jgi:hypothetical protein
VSSHKDVSRRHVLGTRALAFILLLPPILWSLPAGAQQNERSIRTAFVFNLTKYVEWPRRRDELKICSVGEGSIGQTLKRVLNGKSSDGRVIQILTSPSPDQLNQCAVLYVSDLSSDEARTALDKVSGKDILTIGEDDKFVRAGGMVGLVRNGDHIQIEVNLDATKAANLKIASQLLNLAVVVHRGRRE